MNLEPSDFPNYRLKMFINFVIAMGANALGFCLIVWASPKHIQTYRWFLLDILFSAFCLDLYMMAIYQPAVIFPVFGYCTLGIMSRFGHFIGFIGLYIFFMLLGFCAGAVLSASAFRLAAVYNCQNLLTSQMGISTMVFLHLFIPVPMHITLSFVVEELNDQLEEELKANYSKIYPNMRHILLNEVCLVATVDSQKMRIALLAAICTLVIFALIAISIIICGFVSLHKRKAKYSEQLYKMHTQLSISLLVQISIPCVVVLLPFLILVIGMLFQFALLRDMMEAYFLVFSMHSTLNAFAMIVFTRPYRDAVKKWLLKVNKIVQTFGRRLSPGNSQNQVGMIAEGKQQQAADNGLQAAANPTKIVKAVTEAGKNKSANSNRKILTKIT